jgi:hypothetical protein
LKEKHAPFMFNLHCVAHRTNLVVQTLPQLSLVLKIESLFHLMYKALMFKEKNQLVEFMGENIS